MRQDDEHGDLPQVRALTPAVRAGHDGEVKRRGEVGGVCDVVHARELLQHRVPSGFDRVAEMPGIADEVIGRQNEQQWIVTLRCRFERGHGDGRCRVASHRFQQDGVRLDADLTHLFRHDEAVILIADQQWSGKTIQSSQALLGLLQQGGVTLSAERPVLLGVAGT